MPKRVQPDVVLRLSVLASQHKDWVSRRLADQVNEEFPTDDPHTFAVSERWVRDHLAELRDRSEYWTLRPGERDVSFVLDVLLSESHPGDRFPRLTVDEVGWLRVVHEAAPWLEPAAALRVARLYMAADKLTEAAGVMHVFDVLLAQKIEPTTDLAKWRDGKPSPVGWYGGRED